MQNCSFFYKIVFFALALFTIWVFFSTGLTVSYDTAHYHHYLPILNGEQSWSSWAEIRGLGFPLLLNVMYSILGKTRAAFFITNFTLYAITLCFCIKILHQVTGRHNPLILLALVMFFIFDSLILGTFHLCLTEPLATTIFTISISFALSLFNTRVGSNKVLTLFLAVYFILAVPIMWHVKQPYVMTALGPLIIVGPLSLLQNDLPKTDKFVRICILLMSLLSLNISTSIWQSFLIDQKKDLKHSTSQIVDEYLLNGLSRNGQFLIVENQKSKIEKYDFFTTEQKNFYVSSLPDRSEHYLVLAKTENNYNQLKYDGDTQIGVIFFLLKKRPFLFLKSHLQNYLIIANVLPYKLTPFYRLVPPGISFQRTYEIKGYFYSTYKGGLVRKNHNPLYPHIEHLDKPSNTPPLITNLFTSIELKSTFIFSVLLVLIPFTSFIILIYTLVDRSIINRPSSSSSIIVGGSVLLHVLLHSIFGANIDRYATPVYPVMITYIFSMFIVAFIWLKNKTGK